MSLSANQTHRLLKRVYDGYKYMLDRYPKAAKKARIRKKWRKRFGRGMSDMIADEMPNPFAGLLRGEEFCGERFIMEVELPR